jgi:hypothetical protein
MSGRAGFTAVEIVLYVVSAERKSGRAPVDDASNGWTMAFAEGSDREDVTERVAGHLGLLHKVKLDA